MVWAISVPFVEPASKSILSSMLPRLYFLNITSLLSKPANLLAGEEEKISSSHMVLALSRLGCWCHSVPGPSSVLTPEEGLCSLLSLGNLRDPRLYPSKCPTHQPSPSPWSHRMSLCEYWPSLAELTQSASFYRCRQRHKPREGKPDPRSHSAG